MDLEPDRDDELQDLSPQDAEEIRAFLEKRRWFEGKLKVSRGACGWRLRLIVFARFSSRYLPYFPSCIPPSHRHQMKTTMRRIASAESEPPKPSGPYRRSTSCGSGSGKGMHSRRKSSRLTAVTLVA